MPSSHLLHLSRATARSRIADHHGRLLPFIDRHIHRRTHGERHPVYDFLFTYYSFTTGQLLRWTPGLDVHVELDPADELDWPDHSSRDARGFSLDPSCFPARRLPFLRWAINFLDATRHRPPVFHCFGLHEWAMVYRTPENRYREIPLRVTSAELDRVVEEAPLRCTHYDAFRFFTEAAAPLNRLALRSDTVTENDQPGCIHATMDLYRLGYKIAPYTSSALLADLFLLARDAREIDMQASPYDLSHLGFAPIAIETKEGREQYVERQRSLYERAQPCRLQLSAVYRELLRQAVQVEPGEAPSLRGSADWEASCP